MKLTDEQLNELRSDCKKHIMSPEELGGDPGVGMTIPIMCDPFGVIAMVEELQQLRTDLSNEKARGIHSCHPGCMRDGCVNRRLRAELAECKRALDARSVDERYASRLAIILECALMRHDDRCWDDGMALLEEYRAAWAEVNPQPRTFMGEPVIDAAMQAASQDGE